MAPKSVKRFQKEFSKHLVKIKEKSLFRICGVECGNYRACRDYMCREGGFLLFDHCMDLLCQENEQKIRTCKLNAKLLLEKVTAHESLSLEENMCRDLALVFLNRAERVFNNLEEHQKSITRNFLMRTKPQADGVCRVDQNELFYCIILSCLEMGV